ncbi:MAG: hypothetical protein AMXMBFR83_15550 [Phycisphaerae bacterium]
MSAVVLFASCAAPPAGELADAGSGAAPEKRPLMLIGLARRDVTPEQPIRLSGYGARRRESEGVAQRLWAKALAIGEQDRPALLVSVDNCGVPAAITEEVARRLNAKTGLPRERFTLCSSHTHAGPCLGGALATLFGGPIPADQQERIDRYTARLTDLIEQAALDALADRRPGRVSWAEGRAGFAANRRAVKDGKYVGFGVNPDGPVDHTLPMLAISGPDGRLRAVVVNYACHCTTLEANFNQVCGDWAGFVQEYVERAHPGSLCLVTIGCGADANPNPRGRLEDAQRHAREIADEVDRLLKGSLRPLSEPPVCRFERIRLPYDRVPSRTEWERRAKGTRAAAYHASLQLARLDRGEALPTELSYPVQTWAFGGDLNMIFLGGEVVVDYALALRKEFASRRLWVTAYANDVPCYIPSRRILSEGGYEADESMIYYDRPARLAPAVEELILGSVRRLMAEGK